VYPFTSSRTAASRHTKTVVSQAIFGADTAAIVATMAAPALTPDLALQYLGELSTDIKASVVASADGATAAASLPGDGGDRLRELTQELFEHADAADEQTVAQVEVSTGDGAVYAVRDERWTVGVVTGRFALSSLMFYDLRSVLGDLEGR
jgi:predicted regulator of Ras-like GTPase activity (Roadblock/LC7/MglB family)